MKNIFIDEKYDIDILSFDRNPRDIKQTLIVLKNSRENQSFEKNN